MATQKQIDANRRNAQLSTGPRTPEGQARSRLNALKHGLSAGLAALPPDRRREFLRRYKALARELRPVPPEDLLVKRLALAATNLHASWAFEAALFNRAVAGQRAQYPELSELRLLGRAFLSLCQSGAFDTLLRYQAKAQRAFDRAAADLAFLKMKNGKNEANRRAAVTVSNSLFPQSISAKMVV